MSNASKDNAESIDNAIEIIPDGNRAEVRTESGEILSVIWKPYPEQLVRGGVSNPPRVFRAVTVIATAVSLMIVLAFLNP